jgi:hypothetical protein
MSSVDENFVPPSHRASSIVLFAARQVNAEGTKQRLKMQLRQTIALSGCEVFI